MQASSIQGGGGAAAPPIFIAADIFLKFTYKKFELTWVWSPDLFFFLGGGGYSLKVKIGKSTLKTRRLLSNTM